MLDNVTHFLLLTALILIIIVFANIIMGASCMAGYYSTHDYDPNTDNSSTSIDIDVGKKIKDSYRHQNKMMDYRENEMMDYY